MKNETARREIESLDYYLQNHTNDYSEKSHTAMMMAIEALKAEPVKHGEWETGLLREFRNTDIEAQEKADKAGYVRYVVNLKCSACGKITMVDNSIKYNFCPNCGADMRGEKE